MKSYTYEQREGLVVLHQVELGERVIVPSDRYPEYNGPFKLNCAGDLLLFEVGDGRQHWGILPLSHWREEVDKLAVVDEGSAVKFGDQGSLAIDDFFAAMNLLVSLPPESRSIRHEETVAEHLSGMHFRTPVIVNYVPLAQPTGLVWNPTASDFYDAMIGGF